MPAKPTQPRVKAIPKPVPNDPDFDLGGQQCAATSKATGKRCRRRADLGTHVCVPHGARGIVASRMPDAPQRKHGRYAGIREGLLDAYLNSKNDPDLLSLREEIHLVDAMLSEALQAVDAGPDRQLWKEARTHFSRFEVAMLGGDDRQMREAFAALRDVIGTGNTVALAINQVLELMEKRRKLVESERKRYIEMKALVTMDELTTIVQKFGEIAQRHIKDPGVLRAISIDMQRALEAA